MGMDLSSKNMYETFKDEIWQELGPLDPDWFDTLTSQTFANEENVCDQEDLHVNQEEGVKTPFDRAAVDSQLFSTPKVFRHRRVVSPEAEDEQLYSAERDKVASPWTATQSPCLFPISKEGVPSVNYGGIQHQSPGSFDLLHTPQKSNRSVGFAMNISESLGPHIHSDISWTSSLNTPPAVPSTLILSKPDESPSPMSVSADGVVFVRKLFPSLSNASRVEMVSPNSKDMSNIHQGGVSSVAGQNPESHDSSESSLNHSDCSWRQTLPDAIEDGEIRSTIASVLAGAENVLSIFFSNSSSALRKVKADRIKRKQIVPTKEDGCRSVDTSTLNNAASSGQKTAEQEPGRLLSPPHVKTQETGTTQWSPLSLSQIPPCTMDTSCCDIVPPRQVVENNISTERPQSELDSSQLVRQLIKTPDSVFTKKKRKFVYTVTSKPPQDDTQSQKLNCSPSTPYSGPGADMKPPVKVPDKADGMRSEQMQKRANLADEHLPYPVQDQDLDISQLSHVFAQDFSQISKVAENTTQNGFSPSACLTAMKRTHLKSRQGSLNHDYDVSQRRSVSSTNQNSSINERTVSDSGFHSAVTDVTHVTASSFVLPSSENNDQNQQWMGFKEEIHRTHPFLSTAKGNGHLDILHEESQTLSLGRESELCVDNTSTPHLAGSAKEAIDNNNCIRPKSQVYECPPEKTPASLPSVSASGFKTASDRCIQISSAKLERAKRLFEETERESTLSDQPIKCVPGPKEDLRVSHGAATSSTSGSYQPYSENERFVVNSCQLTASQKADVTELCTLLEEADSQFEFTQFQTAKLRHLGRDKATPPQITDKLDPDFLMGIDFDDSFSSDAEKQPAVTMNVVSDMKTDPKHPPTGLSLISVMTRENASTEDASSCFKHTSDRTGGSVPVETKNLDRAGRIETSNTENKNPLLGVGFKTAGGNVLRVSKKCLSKAKALFADLEDGLVTSERSPHKQNGGTDVKKQSKHRVDSNVLHHREAKGKVIRSDNMDTAKFQSGFQMASGRHISFSVKAIEEAQAFFKDCHVMDPVAGTSVKQNLLEGPVSHQSAADGSAGSDTEVAEQNVEIHDFGLNPSALIGTASSHGNPPSTAKALSPPPSSASQRIGSFAVDESSGGGGFCSGEAVLESAVTMNKAESRPSDTRIFKDTNKQPNQKEDAFRKGHLANPKQISLPQTGGFQTASGKGVVISSVALQKAKLLFTECEIVEDEIRVKPRSKMSAPAPPPRNQGFLAASGKSVAVSSKALHKARALFSDISLSADITPASDTKKQDSVEQAQKIHCGFSTAAGTKVHVSQKNLLKAKNLLKEFDEKLSVEADAFFTGCAATTSEEDPSAKHKRSIALGCGSKKKNLSKCQRGQTNNEEKNGITLPESEHVTSEQVNHETMLGRDDLEIPKGFFQNRPDSTSAASLHGNPLLIVKPLSAVLSTTTKDVGSESSCGGGFCTASGKKVSVSDDAVTKAKALLNESAAKEDAGKQTKHKIYSLPPQNAGFQTASGKGVAISSAALMKAKSLLSECEGVEDKIAIEMSAPAPSPRNGGFLKASGKPVAFSPQALQKATALFSDISFSAEIPAAPNTRQSDKNKPHNAGHVETIQCGFSTAGGAKVHVSQEDLSKAKNILKEVDDGSILAKAMQEADAFFDDYDTMSNGDGLSAAHERKTALTSGNDREKDQDQKVTADISGRPGSGCAEVENLTVEAAVNHKSVLLSNGGFQTASGKGVTISHVALQKAKTLLSECEGVQDQSGIKPTHSQMSAPAPPPRKGGFVAASGKPVGFSSEALQRAKALFSDIGLSAELRVDSEASISEHKDHPSDTQKIHGGFTTAGTTTNIRVSQKNLLKAKNPTNYISGGDRHDLNRPSTSRRDTHKSQISKVKDVERTENSKDMSTKDSVPQTAQCFISQPAVDCDEAHQISIGPGGMSHTDVFPSGVGNDHDSSGEEMSSVLDKEINQTGSRERSEVKSTEESQVVCFQSLNLSDCTETQQMFLAQEALDCTKALLQDESVTGQELSVTLEDVPLQDKLRSSNKCGEEQKGTRKRLVEDPEITSQPPLKRRLLEDFDRTVDGLRGSTLHPEKSCPNGVMKDRRVFRYSVALHPNITVPHRDGKSFVDARLQKTTPTKPTTPRDSRSVNSKMPTFVPPFHKNANAESREHTALRDDVRTPSAFVPPFKKQRTVVQESSSKPQEGDAHRHVFVPPTKKTQNTDVTDDKEDTETLADTTSDLMKPQNIPAGCGSETAEASCVEDVSKNHVMFQNLESVELARDMQAMRIRKKKRQIIRPLPGSLFLTKTSGAARIPLKAAVKGKPPARCTAQQLYSHGIHQNVYKITSETAESFRFSLLQFINQDTFTEAGGVQLADGGWLIPNHDGTAGKEEFYRALCDTPGVDPKLISEQWVYNHYRWIVWKQASMERSFPETMGGLCLSPEQVLLQLKYRYDVEVDRSRRPALRKIMEKDDTSAKTLVLCVCGVVSRGHSPKRPSLGENKTPGADPRAENPFAVVWLTDGWYAIKAQLDEPMTAMLHGGRLAVGGKLITHGAQLVGSQDACSPLEAPESLMLKICANSSRPARWDIKLGFYRDPRPFLLPVSCLYSNGGPVGCVDIIILRSYPVQWMERKPDGVVFRSVRAEEKEARRYNSHKQKAVEILLAKVQSEFEKEEKGKNKPQRRRRTISRQDIGSLTDGEELYEAVGDDPTYLEAHLSEQQLEALRGYRSSLMEKKQAELQDRYRRALENAENHEGSCPKRDVTPVWRLSVADSVNQPGRVYQLSLWRPTSDLQSLLREGCRYKVYNLTTSDGRKHGGSTAVQLTGTKKTQFEALEVSPEWLATHFQPRLSTRFVDLQNPDFQPLCGEVDLAGYVISIVDSQGFSPAFYLADGELNFVKVRCFSSFAQSGLGDVVKPRVLFGLSNLQLRGQSTSPTPVVYAGDLTVFSTNPKEAHLQESLRQLRNLVQTQESFFLAAEEKLSHLVRCDGLSAISSPALQTCTPASTRDQRQDTKTQHSVKSLGSFTPISKNPPSTDKDPSSLKRRRALDYLSRIPSPPPLAQLSSVASPCVKKTFNPPRRSATPGSVKTQQTPARKPVHLPPVQDEWVNDEELAMIDTQALHAGDLL